jgi:hypothetical protein
MWADSWLAGAKDGVESALIAGFVLEEDDALVQAVEAVDWEDWSPGHHPPASRLPGFVDVEHRLGELIKGISETTRAQIATEIEQFVGGRVANVPWSNAEVQDLADRLATMLDDPSRAMKIARTEVNRAMSDAAADLYKRSGIAWFNLLNHVGACPICVAVHDANPHPISDLSAYSPQHIQCRCSMAAARPPSS